ncbi:MAG: hypothetical protein K9K66_17785 [Desulfarculaceae bacterium]|nr:hypothetical protein [Desulfarculaceae bacterium]MCF8073377.1 hypothetical protein [Desulfarculaceae bacterium]MCF8103513.1 hypothetical protein [Desulfarculaceae bacterium]MCF8115788.1 hypothetical protein [Desulfarculaceae bacterium]
MKRIALLALSLLMVLSLTLPAMADEISGQLEKGLKLYNDGKLSQAIGEIEFALAQLKQKKAEALSKIFPEAPSGWTAEKAKGSSAGGAMLGGGISASQRYRDGGKGRVKVEVVTDSPLIQSLAMMLSNPMFLQSGNAGKLVRFQGHKAVLKDQGERAELQSLIDNKVLVRVSARRVKDAAAVVQQFAGKMDLNKLKDLTQ